MCFAVWMMLEHSIEFMCTFLFFARLRFCLITATLDFNGFPKESSYIQNDEENLIYRI
jgi:hypothetical protein